MEEKCIEEFETVALNLSKSSSTLTKTSSSLTDTSSSPPSLSAKPFFINCSTASSSDHIYSNSLAADEKEDIFYKPTTSRSSMSLLQEEFETNSQNDFAEVLDDDDDDTTTTSGVLEAYEISSSQLMPTTNDDVLLEPVAVVDDSSSTDTIQIIRVSSDTSTESTARNNVFFNSSEIYVINDDDDDDDVEDVNDEVNDNEDEVEDDEDEDDDEINEVIDNDILNIEEEDDEVVEEDDMNITQQSSCRSIQHNNNSSTHAGSSTEQINNGVIVSTNSTVIFLETPVVEPEQQHHHHHQHLNHNTISLNNHGHNTEFDADNVKPKRLSDEFTKDSSTTVYSNETPPTSTTSSSASNQLLSTEAQNDPMIFDLTESQSCPETQAHERMSSRLKKMNLNNNITNCTNSQDLPSSSSTKATSSSLVMPSTLTDIESMDLLERRDFENEQRLTGGIILKSSSLIKNNKLDLGLVKSHQNTKNSNDKNNCKPGEEHPSSSQCSSHHSRGFSSDSKCTYKDLSATPTSSRKFLVRLTKSTAKMNLCNTLSHQPQQEQQELTTKTSQQRTSTEQIPKPNNTSSTSSSSTSVIVEAAPSLVGSYIYSNSNSNDSLTSRPSSAICSSSTVKRQELLKLEQNQAPSTSTVNMTSANSSSSSSSSAAVRVNENSCSRTSAIQPMVNHNSNHNSNSSSSNEALDDDDAQPSTSSSARCQYAPPPRHSQRQVNASAQTNEKYLARSNNVGVASANDVCISANNHAPSRSGVVAIVRRSEIAQNVMNGLPMHNDHLDNNFAFNHHNSTSWVDCEENNSDLEEICTCHHQGSLSDGSSSHGGSISDLNDGEEFDASHHIYGKDSGGGGGGADLSYNIMHNLSISEDVSTLSPECMGTRKRKYTDSRLMDHDYNSATITGSGGGTGGGNAGGLESNSRKRIAFDFTTTPRSSQLNAGVLVHMSTPSSQLLVATSATGSPLGRRTPRSLIPTRDNPPPELQQWLSQFTRWSHAERLLAVDRLIDHCEPTQVRHMMKVIEPQFQRDFISLLPRELALQVLSYLDPRDLLRAAQTCRSWRFLCDDNLLWKEKCRTAQILTEPRTDRPKRGRAGNMPPIASPWKAAYMRQHIIEMNWRSRPIRSPKVLKGHDEHVITCLQFSGNRIVSGSDDNTLKVWSAVTGRCLRTLVGHTGGVWSSQMSGNIIISGSTDRTLKVWGMETGQCVHTLLGHTSTVRCMHLHGNKVVSGSRDATLRVWDIEQGSCLRVLVGHLAAVRCVQYDGKLIVSGAYDYMVKIWHPERSECLHTLQGHTNRVYSLQFDGVHVVSGSLDTSIRVWDVETGNCKHTLMGHQSLTSGMELRENILVSGNADSTVKVWDITTGQCLQTLSGPNKHQSAVTCLQFNSRFVVTSSDDGTVKLWDVKTGEFIRNLVSLDSGGSGGVVWRIRANDTKLICAVGSRNGTEETKLMVLDFDVEGACVKCS